MRGLKAWRSALICGMVISVVLSGWPDASAAPGARPRLVRPSGIRRPAEHHPPIVAGSRVLVRFVAERSEREKRAARRSVSGEVLRRFHLVPGLELLRVPNARAAATVLSRRPSVRYAVQDVAMRLQAVPNDPLYPGLWGMDRIGAPAAWDRETGRASVTVAVLDTGIRLGHPDLVGNLWRNPDEIANNGVDDDRNGYIDDVRGWDFVGGTNSPFDADGHGTHVAGTIGAVGNNGIGVAGVNWTVRLMPLKVCSSVCYQSDEIAALEYAVDEGAKIANTSFGVRSNGYPPERDAIEAAGNAGLLDVIAAGNEWSDNDLFPFFPASYSLGNIIAVAAADTQDRLASFSNAGARSVDLAAPGTGILSTLPAGAYGSSGGYGALSGTSMAAPHVTGAAALLWAQHPRWTMREIRTRLLTTVRSRSALRGKVLTCGEVDVGAATDPAVPNRARLCLRPTGTGSGTVTSSPARLSCGSRCGATFIPGATVTLRAAPGPTSTFAGWSGPCSGTRTCVVTARGAKIVEARFRAALPSAWSQRRLRSPGGLDVLPAGSDVFASFANVAVSADGRTRAKTIYHYAGCLPDTGGIFLERRADGAWVADATVTAPTLGGADWVRCNGWGTVTKLSGDGMWLLASPEPAMTLTPSGWRDRCAAFVYRRGPEGWTLDASLVPPNADPVTGIADATGCFGWGFEGGISSAGDRIAMWDIGRVDVYRRDATGWVLEQEIVLPPGEGCGATAAPRRLGLATDGGSLIVGEPSCRAGPRTHVYERTGTSWTLVTTLTEGAAEDVSISDDGTVATVNAAVYERDATGWHLRTRLAAPDSLHLGCPAIVDGGARIVCGSVEDVGYNGSQGAIYVFDAADGWGDGPTSVTRLFAPDGFARDGLTMSGMLRWSMVAVTRNGGVILAPMPPDNISASLNPHDLIGYIYRDVSRPAVT